MVSFFLKRVCIALAVSSLLYVFQSGCFLGDSRPCDAQHACSASFKCVQGWCLPGDKFGDLVDAGVVGKPDDAVSQDMSFDGMQDFSPETFGEVTSEPKDCPNSCTIGAKEDCYPDGAVGCDSDGSNCKGLCSPGKRTCEDKGGCGEWGVCKGSTLPSTELCDGDDNDCDGQIDDGLSRPCYTGATGTKGIGECKEGTQTCSQGKWGACVGEVTPVSPDVCDNIDSDCDGLLDEDCGWAAQVSASVGEQTSINSIAIDRNGFLYIAGAFTGILKLGQHSLTSVGSFDAFVAKLDHGGRFVWAKSFGSSGLNGSSGEEYCSGVLVDKSGNVYITGSFSGKVSFGKTDLQSQGGDVFVAKINASESVEWAVRMGSPSQDDVKRMSLDSQGNIVLVGQFYDKAEFGSFSLQSKGKGDIFVTKIKPDGSFVWALRAGSSGDDIGFGLASDPTNNTYVTGAFEGTADFGLQTISSKGKKDAFVAKINSNGEFVWVRRAGSVTGDDIAQGVVADGQKFIYVAGGTSGKADFGKDNLESDEGDIFVTKLDPSGSFLWTTHVGDKGTDVASSIALDEKGNVFLTGVFEDFARFESTFLTSKGSHDVFLARLTPGGKFDWAVSAGSTGLDLGSDILLGPSSAIFAVGTFSGNALFGNHNLVGKGTTDGFVWRIPPL